MVSLNFTAVDDGVITNCSLWVNNALISTNSSVLNNTLTSFNFSGAVNSYYWNVTCYDGLGNFSSSDTWLFRITSTFSLSSFSLTAGTCPSTVANVGLLLIVVVLAVVLLLIGWFAVPIIGLLGSVIFVMLGMVMITCFPMIGFVLGGCGILLFVHFIFFILHNIT